VAEYKLAEAMVTTIKGSKEPSSIYFLPRFSIGTILKLALQYNARTVNDDVLLKELLTILHFEIELIRKTVRTFENTKMYLQKSYCLWQ
jgi:hypothetical protein